jgi:hypothetical protein
MKATLRAPAFVLALLLPACSSNFPNPFADTTRTAVPRASAAVLFTSNLHAQAGAPREAFAVDADGSNPTQLTFCSTAPRPCDTLEVSAAPDRQRVIVRRRLDANNDGRLDASDTVSMLFVDLSRGTEASLVPATSDVSGLDWSPTGDVLVYAGIGQGGLEDLWRMDPNGQNNRNLTSSPTVRERRLRVDPSGTVAVFERIETGGKAAVYLFVDQLRQGALSSGGPGTDTLAGTPYIVGSDADPDFSPDGGTVVLRRLTGTGAGGLGTWDLLTVRSDGTGTPQVIASGNIYRGAPDWGPSGIVFEEADTAGGPHRLVVVQGDGSGRRVIFTGAGGIDLSEPRWLP